MIIIKDLKLVRKSYNKKNGIYDGIYKKDESYYLTFCHGDDYGNMNLQIKDTLINITPDQLREQIKRNFNLKIGVDKKIFIHPCSPKQVRQRYEKELKNNNIHINCNNWEGLTGHIFYDGEFVYTHTKKRKKKFVDIIIDKGSKMIKMCEKGTLEGYVISKYSLTK